MSAGEEEAASSKREVLRWLSCAFRCVEGWMYHEVGGWTGWRRARQRQRGGRVGCGLWVGEAGGLVG